MRCSMKLNSGWQLGAQAPSKVERCFLSPLMQNYSQVPACTYIHQQREAEGAWHRTVMAPSIMLSLSAAIGKQSYGTRGAMGSKDSWFPPIPRDKDSEEGPRVVTKRDFLCHMIRVREKQNCNLYPHLE